MVAELNVRGVEDTIRDLKKFEEKLDREMDNAAEKLAEKGAESAEDALIAQGSVASETGINSLKALRINKHHYATVGRSYLNIVETGSQPHTPEIDTRLIIWASVNGWKVSDIVQHIEEEGTRSRPWKENAFDPVRKSAGKEVGKHLRRSFMRTK